MLQGAILGRSHRSPLALQRIQDVVSLTREILEIPDDYYVGIVPGSSTGAMEMGLWNLWGPVPVDVYAWDVFGKVWADDIMNHLCLPETHLYESPEPGCLPPLEDHNPAHDMVMTLNGTTTGVRVPHFDWIQPHREGLVFVDGCSAFFAMEVDWCKIDVAALSWQKCLGGEGAHGMLVLSPKALKRLKSYTPPWPVPRLFCLKKEGVFLEAVFEGKTLNTPSMLCVEDVYDSLLWCKAQGGLKALIRRSQANLKAVEAWVARTPWVDFLVKDPAARSSTSITLELKDVHAESQWDVIHGIRDLLAAEAVAYDINGHLLSHPCLRLWGGPMIETEDLQKLFQWLEWAYERQLI